MLLPNTLVIGNANITPNEPVESNVIKWCYYGNNQIKPLSEVYDKVRSLTGRHFNFYDVGSGHDNVSCVPHVLRAIVRLKNGDRNFDMFQSGAYEELCSVYGDHAELVKPSPTGVTPYRLGRFI